MNQIIFNKTQLLKKLLLKPRKNNKCNKKLNKYKKYRKYKRFKSHKKFIRLYKII